MGLGCSNKINIGKIRPQLRAESSLKFLAWLVGRSNTGQTQNFVTALVLGWLFTKHAQNPVTLNAAGRGEGGRVFLCWQLTAFIPSSSQNLLGHGDSKSFSVGSLPFSDCFSDISHPSHVSLSSSGPVGLGLLGEDGQNGLCLHTVLRDHAGNHPLHLLSLLLPPPSPFPALVQKQAPGPSPFALAKTLAGCLHLAVRTPSCPHHWVPVLLCQVFQAVTPTVSPTSAHAGTVQPLQNTQSAALASTSLMGLYPAAGKTISLLCSSFLLPSW